MALHRLKESLEFFTSSSYHRHDIVSQWSSELPILLIASQGNVIVLHNSDVCDAFNVSYLGGSVSLLGAFLLLMGSVEDNIDLRRATEYAVWISHQSPMSMRVQQSFYLQLWNLNVEQEKYAEIWTEKDCFWVVFRWAGPQFLGAWCLFLAFSTPWLEEEVHSTRTPPASLIPITPFQPRLHKDIWEVFQSLTLAPSLLLHL